jgi:hypothetical protein
MKTDDDDLNHRQGRGRAVSSAINGNLIRQTFENPIGDVLQIDSGAGRRYLRTLAHEGS